MNYATKRAWWLHGLIVGGGFSNVEISLNTGSEALVMLKPILEKEEKTNIRKI